MKNLIRRGFRWAIAAGFATILLAASLVGCYREDPFLPPAGIVGNHAAR